MRASAYVGRIGGLAVSGVKHPIAACSAALQRIVASLLAAVVLAGLVTVSVAETSVRTASLRGAVSHAVALLSEQVALIMNGTFEPVVTQAWIDQVMSNLITPTLGYGYTGTAMTTPEEFWPVSGLTDLTFNKSIQVGYDLLNPRVHENIANNPYSPQVVFGYSQSAIIASVEKRTLAAEYPNLVDAPPVTFELIGNPYRPNGGFLSRVPLVARVLTSSTNMTSTPTDTPFQTVDIARQYDLWADFPTYPLNLLSDINSLFGLVNHWYLPESVNGLLSGLVQTVSLDPNSPNYNPDTTVQQYGDTTYYFIPSKNLPMFYPLRWIGLGPVVDVFEPLVRVFVELGYDRSAPAGQVVRARLLPGLNNLTIDNARTFVSDVDDALRQGGQALVDLFCPPKASTPASTPVTIPATVAAVSPAAAKRIARRPAAAAVTARAAASDDEVAAPRELVPAAVAVSAPRPGDGGKAGLITGNGGPGGNGGNASAFNPTAGRGGKGGSGSLVGQPGADGNSGNAGPAASRN